MRIDYCPDCNKAGLRECDTEGRNDLGRTRQESYEIFSRGERLTPEGYIHRKWCPRCSIWVEPINRPYLGSMHRK